MRIDKSFDEELNRKSRIVLSVYQTPKKLQLAQTLLKGPLTIQEIVNRTDTIYSTVSVCMKEMHECGVVDKRREGLFQIYSLTEFGRRLLGFFP